MTRKWKVFFQFLESSWELRPVDSFIKRNGLGPPPDTGGAVDRNRNRRLCVMHTQTGWQTPIGQAGMFLPRAILSSHFSSLAIVTVIIFASLNQRDSDTGEQGLLCCYGWLYRPIYYFRANVSPITPFYLLQTAFGLKLSSFHTPLGGLRDCWTLTASRILCVCSGLDSGHKGSADMNGAIVLGFFFRTQRPLYFEN